MIHNSNFSVCGVLLEHSHTLGDCCCCPVTKSRLTLCDPTDAAHQASLPISWSLFKLMSIWVGEAIQPSHPFYVICPGYFSNLRSCGSGLHSLYSSHTGPWLIPKHTRPRSSLITTTAPPLPPEVYTIEKKSEKSPATHPSVSVPFLIFFMALFTPDMFQVHTNMFIVITSQWWWYGFFFPCLSVFSHFSQWMCITCEFKIILWLWGILIIIFSFIIWIISALIPLQLKQFEVCMIYFLWVLCWRSFIKD